MEMENPPKKNQQAMIAFMKRVTLPRILKDMQEKEGNERPNEEKKDESNHK
jgi:hypothetical protein